MKRKRTIAAIRISLAANILEILGILFFAGVMTFIGLIFSDLVASFGGDNSFGVFFKLGGFSIILALVVIAGIIALIVAGRKIKGFAEYSAQDYKNKSIIITSFNVFSFIVAGIVNAIAFWFIFSQNDVKPIFYLAPIYTIICFILWLISTILLCLDKREANKMVKQNAVSSISTSNYNQKVDVENSQPQANELAQTTQPTQTNAPENLGSTENKE